MDSLELRCPKKADIPAIRAYIAEFPADRMRVTFNPQRIPGLDGCEEYPDVAQWLAYCRSMRGKISWYMTVRKNDGKLIGFICLRHSMEYDDDEGEFASHIGYSVRPGERNKGYATEQLRLTLMKARQLGLPSVRLICRVENEASNRVILRCGGKFIDTIHGEESGLNVNRYDIPLT